MHGETSKTDKMSSKNRPPLTSLIYSGDFSPIVAENLEGDSVHGRSSRGLNSFLSTHPKRACSHPEGKHTPDLMVVLPRLRLLVSVEWCPCPTVCLPNPIRRTLLKMLFQPCCPGRWICTRIINQQQVVICRCLKLQAGCWSLLTDII